MNNYPTLSALRRSNIGFGAFVQLNPFQWRFSFEREFYNFGDFNITVMIGPIALEMHVD